MKITNRVVITFLKEIILIIITFVWNNTYGNCILKIILFVSYNVHQGGRRGRSRSGRDRMVVGFTSERRNELPGQLLLTTTGKI